MMDITICSITHADGAAIRSKVLRPDGKKVAAGSSQYEDADAIHLGAYRNGSLAAVVSFTPYDEDGVKASHSYQLRSEIVAKLYPGKRLDEKITNPYFALSVHIPIRQMVPSPI